MVVGISGIILMFLIGLAIVAAINGSPMLADAYDSYKLNRESNKKRLRDEEISRTLDEERIKQERLVTRLLEQEWEDNILSEERRVDPSFKFQPEKGQ